MVLKNLTLVVLRFEQVSGFSTLKSGKRVKFLKRKMKMSSLLEDSGQIGDTEKTVIKSYFASKPFQTPFLSMFLIHTFVRACR